MIQLVGDKANNGEVLDRIYVAEKIFSNKELLQEVNSIVHPEVALHFNQWLEQQKGTYCIKEAAILFESGSYLDCDITILVKAPKDIRLARVVKRDNTTVEDVSKRMSHQWSDSKKESLADIIIENTDLNVTKKKVHEIHISLQ